MAKSRGKLLLKEKALEEIVFGRDIIGSKSTSKQEEEDTDSHAIVVQGPIAAWEDEEDTQLEVNLSTTNRLKKLKRDDSTDDNNNVSAGVFTQLLQERFQTRQLAWAAVETADTADIGDEDDDLMRRTDSLVETSTRQLRKRKTMETMATTSSSRRGGEGEGTGSDESPLPEGKINIVRLTDANASEPAVNESVTALQFHPSGRLLMVASGDKHLRFFRVDGDKNEKQLSVKFNDMSITCAAFLGGSSEVVVSGRKPFFYSYDTASGLVTKLPGLMGKGLKSHETMCVTPSGSRIAFAGAGGYVHIVCGRLKTWQMDVKMNCACRAISFVDEHTLVTSGLDAEVYVWGLQTKQGTAGLAALTGHGRCLGKFHHEDGTCTSSLGNSLFAQLQGSLTTKQSSNSNNINSSSSYVAVGAESGVMTLYYLDNITSNIGISRSSGGRGLGGGSRNQTTPSSSSSSIPRMMKSIMNLTTKITAVAFHPSGELMALASDQKKDQLKLVHLPSCTVYTNWPTEKTPLRKVTSLSFSPGGGYVAVGNDRGRVLLYRLTHYNNT